MAFITANQLRGLAPAVAQVGANVSGVIEYGNNVSPTGGASEAINLGWPYATVSGTSSNALALGDIAAASYATNAGAAGGSMYAMSNSTWVAFTPGAGGGSITTPVWTTNLLNVTNSNLAYALSALPSVHGRRIRISNATTNIGGPLTVTLTAYDGNSNQVNQLDQWASVPLSTANSPSNSLAGTNIVYCNGLNALNGTLLNVATAGGANEWATLKSLSSEVTTAWSTNGGYNGAQEIILSLCVYNGKLYAGQGEGAGDGDVLVFDGSTWSTSYDGAQERISSLCVYNGKLYAGQGANTGDGDVYTLQTLQSATLESGLTNAHTNPVITATYQFPAHLLATNLLYKVYSDNAGAAAETIIRVETEVMQ
jgi:hypothetical protein